jgi:hypothetical protein
MVVAMSGFTRAAVVLALAVPAIAVLPGCAAKEKICAPGQVAIEYQGGGRSCEEPKPGDRTCPDGEILLKNPDVRREGCIPNVYSPDSYTDKLPATSTT